MRANDKIQWVAHGMRKSRQFILAIFMENCSLRTETTEPMQKFYREI